VGQAFGYQEKVRMPADRFVVCVRRSAVGVPLQIKLTSLLGNANEK
jgi:hypothetical protein